MRKVLVPLTHMKSNGPEFMYAHIVRSSFVTKLLKYDLLPVFISVLYPKSMIDVLYAECSGVFLMGGSNINPQFYGEIANKYPNLTAPKRADDTEIYIAKKALQDKKPILGICRGMQILNIACQGTLYQCMKELNLRNEKHALGGKYNEDLLTIMEDHKVHIKPDTIAHKELGTTEILTNSAHMQCIKKIGECLEISGVTSEGIIEIIEHTDKSFFCLGIQSHPEILEDSFFEPLFKAFSRHIV
jgi:putative glutamine amidotransferase